VANVVKVLILCIFLFTVAGAQPVVAGWTTDGAPVCVYTGDQEYQVVCPDGAGGAIIAWEDRRAYPDIYVQRIDENGRRVWAVAGVAICTASYGQYGPRICSDGAGGAIIAWTDARASNVRDVYAQRIGPDGNVLWTADGAPVCTETANQYLYDIRSDGAGGALLVWQDERVSVNYDDIYCQRIDADGNVLWNATGVPLSTGVSFLRERPEVVSDGSGGGIFTWIDWGGGGIFAQRVNAAGIVQWAVNGAVVCNAANSQYEPHIVTDGSGGAVIGWYDHRVWYDIYVQRVDPLGNMLWTANGVQLTDDGGGQIWQAYARMCPDNEGGAVIAWVDQRVDDYDCYAQRVNGDGIPQWTANGVAICTETGGCDEISLLSVADKGAILTWEDSRSGAGSDVYTQRIDSLGAVQWDVNGIAICTAERSQYYPRITTDGADGAIIAWQDERILDDADIYARRITSAGDLVATLLRSYAAAFRGDAVVIEWTLSEMDGDARFTVSRMTAPAGDCIELPPEGLSREGLIFRYVDTGYDPGVASIYRVGVETGGGSRLLFMTDPITPPATALTLHQNHPNPFNPSTAISYYLPWDGHVTLGVYDATGREIIRLIDGEQAAGPKSVTWSGLNGSGIQIESGVYFYRLTAGKETRSRKLLLLR